MSDGLSEIPTRLRPDPDRLLRVTDCFRMVSAYPRTIAAPRRVVSA